MKNSKTSLNSSDFYVVGVGASAGGLEAIHELFDNLPADTDFSYLIVQHLSIDYKSLLTELLAKHTNMRVCEAEDKMRVKPNSVYVIPNHHDIILENGHIKFVEKAKNAPNNAIDVLFNSLGTEKKSKAIGVLLSGTGTDGTKGLATIKKNGGLVVVQDPVTAKFDGMPQNAISSGNVDLILPPELMPEEILRKVKNLKKSFFPQKITEEDEEAVTEILDIIRKHTQCDFSSYKRPTIMRRLSKRMAVRNFKDLYSYLQYFKYNSDEISALGKEFLIGVTKFFRDEEAFNVIANHVVPHIVASKKREDLVKVWVAGCSTGEEAYSIAILIDEFLSTINKPLEVKIFATDIDAEAIEIASKGLYPSKIVEDLPPERLTKYFEKVGRKYQVNQHIRKMVIFAHHDLIKDPPFGKIDLLTCRNLLIYISPDLQKKIMSIFNFSLNREGYLFLGPSENPGGFSDYLTDVNKKWKIYQKVKSHVPNASELANARFPLSATPGKKPVSFVKERNTHDNLYETLNEAVLEEFDYAGVFVNESYELVQALGNFKNYLQLPDKKLNLNLLKMVPPELSTALATSMRRAVKKQEKVSVKGIKYNDEKGGHRVNIVIKPFFNENRNLPKLILVLFNEDVIGSKVNEDYEEYNEHFEKDSRVQELEVELKDTKELLQATVEEQETSNEELQSANEELISANEELQSTNEELQSLNEELHTVNTEHQLKIKELIELNDDLNNYFKSSNIGQVFVDKDLIIRKFTPSITSQINLIEADIGRSLHHISNNIDYGFLDEDLKYVMEKGVTSEVEVKAKNGNWYQMRIFPYERHSKIIDGAVISFVDITALKELNNMVSGVINSSKNSIVALKVVREKRNVVDFEWLLINEPAERLLGQKAESLEGKTFSSTSSVINTKDFFHKYSQVVDTGEILHLEHYYEVKKQWFDIVGVKMGDGIAITITDISDKKDSEQKVRLAFDEVKVAREKLQKLNKELERRVEERTKELSVSEERFRILSLATNDVVRDWDLVQNTVWWNKGLQKLFGYDLENITPGIQFWKENIHPEEKEEVLQKLNEKINSGQNQWTFEYRFRRNDRSYAYVLDRGYVIHDENGMPYRMITSMVDLSDLKDIQEDLRNTNDNLMRINMDLDNFIYTASHDLKAPISNIEGLVHTLSDILDCEKNEEAATVIGLINESILKFKKTIMDLTEITRIQKEMEEDEGKVIIQLLLEEIKDSIKPLIEHSKVQIKEEIEGKEIHFSRKNIRSILYNLLSNAIKYRSPKREPEVTISTFIKDGNFHLSIADNGLGISPEKQKKVFSMFKRFHDHVDGSGVGMYIVKRIIDNVGGEISLESELDKGTTFHITLPVEKKEVNNDTGKVEERNSKFS